MDSYETTRKIEKARKDVGPHGVDLSKRRGLKPGRVVKLCDETAAALRKSLAGRGGK